jgi:hypothetical protein
MGQTTISLISSFAVSRPAMSSHDTPPDSITYMHTAFVAQHMCLACQLSTCLSCCWWQVSSRLSAAGQQLMAVTNCCADASVCCSNELPPCLDDSCQEAGPHTLSAKHMHGVLLSGCERGRQTYIIADCLNEPWVMLGQLRWQLTILAHCTHQPQNSGSQTPPA